MTRTTAATPERSGTTRNDPEQNRTATHLEQGRPVTVLIRPRLTRKDLPAPRYPFVRTSPYPVRNVLIERADGSRVVRPWRGLAPITP